MRNTFHIFRDVKKNNISDSIQLSKLTNDTILSLSTFDINADGINEIIVGTYSKKLLVYSLNKPVINNEINYENKFEYKLPSPVISLYFIFTLLGVFHPMC